MKLLLCSFVLFGASVAIAAPPVYRTVTAPLPQLGQSTAAPLATDESAQITRPSSRLSFSASTWDPTNLELPGAGTRLGGFHRTPLPQLGLSWKFAPLAFKNTRFNALRFSPQVGLALTALRRTGQATFAGTPQWTSQLLYFFPAKLGVTAAPVWTEWKYARLQASISALPSIAFSERSVFERGSTHLGLGAEYALGVASTTLESADLTLEAFFTHGTLGFESGLGSLTGQGLRAEITF